MMRDFAQPSEFSLGHYFNDKNETISPLCQKCIILQAENATLRKDLLDRENELIEWRKKAFELKEENAALKGELAQKQLLIDEYARTEAKDKRYIAELQAELAEMRAKLNSEPPIVKSEPFTYEAHSA